MCVCEVCACEVCVCEVCACVMEGESDVDWILLDSLWVAYYVVYCCHVVFVL